MARRLLPIWTCSSISCSCAVWPPWHANAGKRLVKSPRVYVRDSGLVHTLLGLDDQENVLGHPVAGASYEGFVIETLCAAAPEGAQANFYRTSAGAEIDLVLTLPGGRIFAIEIKRSLSPKLERGFYHACEDLKPEQRIVVYPGTEPFPLRDGVEVMPLQHAALALQEI
jgi:predicted AAA+ superfamily ATPase